MKATVKYLFVLLLSAVAAAADAQTPEMADRMRAEGKIFVVVAIILIILAGLIAYLFAMDRKVKKLEDFIKEKTGTPK